MGLNDACLAKARSSLIDLAVNRFIPVYRTFVFNDEQCTDAGFHFNGTFPCPSGIMVGFFLRDLMVWL